MKFEFGNFFGGPKQEKPVTKLPETAEDKVAEAYLAQLRKEGFTDKDVNIQSVTGEATTEKRPENTPRPSYLSDRKAA